MGHRIGPRVATLVSRAMAEHLHRSLHTRAKLHAEGLNEFFRGMTAEKRAHTAPLWRLLTEDPDMPPELKQALAFIAGGTGELSEIMGALSMGQALSTPISAALSNYLAPTNQNLISKDPHSVFDPGTAARAYLTGIDTGIDWLDDANRGGISNPRFEALVAMAEQFPGVGELLTLLRRGEITEQEANHALIRNGVATGYAPRLLALKRDLLGVPDAALAVLRGHISKEEGEQIAEQQGINSKDFGTLLYNTGEPPAAESMMEALRRGFINDATFDQAILQSRIRDEWIPVMKQLRFSPMATADAVEAVVRNYIPDAKGKQIAEQNGLEPEHWETLLLAHGRPLALGQVLSLWLRDELTKEQVEQAIRESDIKDKYIPAALELRHKLLPEHLIMQLLEKGYMTEARAHESLTHSGFRPEDVEAILKAGGSSKAAKAKTETEAQVVGMYETHMIDAAKAEGMLHTLGYSPADAQLLLALAELKRERAVQEAAAGAVRGAYLARHISKGEAEGQLSALGLTAARTAYLLRVWDIELAGRRKTLTEPQIVKAAKAGKMTQDEAIERLVGLGYSQDDAAHLYAIYA